MYIIFVSTDGGLVGYDIHRLKRTALAAIKEDFWQYCLCETEEEFRSHRLNCDKTIFLENVGDQYYIDN